jgi:Ca2+-dependent lipid-binding protein
MMPMGIMDVIFKGRARVELTPLLTKPPFFGAVAISFTEVPKIDFNLTGIANIVELPFLSDILHNTIGRIVADMFVLPKKFMVPMIPVENMSLYQLTPMEIMHPFAKGCIFIHIKKANNLVAKDNVKALGMKLLKGKSDPYVKITFGYMKKSTRVIKKELNPTWNEEFNFPIPQPWPEKIYFNLYDHDLIGGHDELGLIVVNVSDVMDSHQGIYERIDQPLDTQGSLSFIISYIEQTVRYLPDSDSQETIEEDTNKVFSSTENTPNKPDFSSNFVTSVILISGDFWDNSGLFGVFSVLENTLFVSSSIVS